MITLDNGILSVRINELGAEIKSVQKNGEERMWPGRPEIWNNTAPLMFPICGGLKENKYTFEGKEYTLNKHGYMRTTMFEMETADTSSAVFLHKSSEETKKNYPFDYELRVIYTLDGDGIKIEYRVDNKSEKTMYFSIGSHEAYYTPEGIEDYDVIFPEKETLLARDLYGSIVANTSRTIIKNSCVLPLYEKFFMLDTLVFTSLKSRSATLRNRKNGKGVRVDFPDASYFLIWHIPNAPYICLEPWGGISDIHGSGYDITEKEGITALDVGKTYTATHMITFIEE